MKLYVGAWSDGDAGVFVASGKAQFEPYALRCSNRTEDVWRVTFAILVDHLQDAGRALALRAGFERTVGPRLRGKFRTLRESEVAEVTALIERGEQAT